MALSSLLSSDLNLEIGGWMEGGWMVDGGWMDGLDA